MKTLLFAAVAAVLVTVPVLVLAFAPAPDAGSRPVEHKSYDGYGVSRDAGLKGDNSFLALTAKAEFDRIFYPVLTRRGLPDAVGKDAFDTRLFVAAIKSGNVLYEFKVEKVSAKGDTLTVEYTAAPFKRGGAAPGTTERVGSFSTSKGGTSREVRDSRREPPGSVATARATTEKVAATQKAETQKGETRAARGETIRVGPRATSSYERPVLDTSRSRDASTGFDSPLIVSVPKDKYLTVIFIENGRKVGTARVGN